MIPHTHLKFGIFLINISLLSKLLFIENSSLTLLSVAKQTLLLFYARIHFILKNIVGTGVYAIPFFCSSSKGVIKSIKCTDFVCIFPNDDNRNDRCEDYSEIVQNFHMYFTFHLVSKIIITNSVYVNSDCVVKLSFPSFFHFQLIVNCFYWQNNIHTRYCSSKVIEVI